MVLFTKVYGEMSSRINKVCEDAITATHFKRIQEPERQEAARLR
jgi:hypothetical protein